MCGVADYAGKLVYRVGGGLQQLRDAKGNNTDESIQDVYLVGGVARMVNWQKSGSDSRVHCGTVVGTSSWKKDAPSAEMPLPFGSTQGDSGSPYFVWCGDAFKFLMAHHGSTAGNRQTLGCFAQNCALEKMNADTVTVSMADVSGKLFISAPEKAEDKGSVTDVFNGTQVTVAPAVSYLRDAEGNLYNSRGEAVAFRGVQRGQHTWLSLSPLKNRDNWYTYGADYLSETDSVVVKNKTSVVAAGVTYGKLYLTQNLRLLAPEGAREYTVEPTETVDLGAGYLHFDAQKGGSAIYHVSSPAPNLIDCAGFVVSPGVSVNMSLCNTDASYMREWRKVGAGALRICGKGNNEILLNIGGEGLTALEQSDGYAAYNVLLNTGATLRIKDAEQIARDLTIGAGGGTLDLAGNTLEWFSVAGHTRPGFSIHALTEEAVISNSAGAAKLYITAPGSPAYPGSFRDTKSGSLTVVYDADAPWSLHGIRTALLHPNSAFIVQQGHVALEGTLTIHGYGTRHTRETADFSTLPDDWHYADAAMNVHVADGARFSLKSHARLRGDVLMESGATYTMHESVQRANERIEGGARPESTAAIAAFYGHKGNIKMGEMSQLELVSSAEAEVPTVYSGNIEGPGCVVLNAGAAKAPFTLAGKNDVESIFLHKGRLNIQGKTKTNHVGVKLGTTLAVQYEGEELLRFCGAEPLAALRYVTIDAESPAEAKLTFADKKSMHINRAPLQVAPGKTLTVENALLEPLPVIQADDAFVRLTDVVLSPVATARLKMSATMQLKSRPGVPPRTLKAKQTVPEYRFPQITGNATIREDSSFTLLLSAKEARAKVIRLRFDEEVCFVSPGSLEVKLKTKRNVVIPKVFMSADEPNVLYLFTK